MDILPYRISSLPYDYALQIVRSSFKDFDVQIWSRNGHALKTLTPGASDLDITVYSYSDLDINKFIDRYGNLKLYLPFLGEINWIDSRYVNNFRSYLNPMEANRDEVLKTMIHFEKDVSLSDKTTFFLRCLASDTYGIRENFNARKRKWNRHMLDLGINPIGENIDSPMDIFEYCNHRLVQESIGGSPQNFLTKLIEQKDNDINAWNRFYSKVKKKDFILMAPNHWIGASLHHKSFEEDIKVLSNFSACENDLLISQLEWEIWGLFTQYLYISEKENLISHFKNFKRFSAEVAGGEHLVKGFQYLIEVQT